jgi:hypothetical protein
MKKFEMAKKGESATMLDTETVNRVFTLLNALIAAIGKNGIKVTVADDAITFDGSGSGGGGLAGAAPLTVIGTIDGVPTYITVNAVVGAAVT